MNIRLLIVLIVVAILVAGGSIFFFSKKTPTLTTPKQTQTNNQVSSQPSEAKPSASPISKPAPVETSTYRGTILTASSTTISVKTDSAGNKNFTFSKTSEIYKLTGGTLEGGDAKTANATPTDVKADQQVLVITDKDSSNIQRLVIIK